MNLAYQVLKSEQYYYLKVNGNPLLVNNSYNLPEEDHHCMNSNTAKLSLYAATC